MKQQRFVLEVKSRVENLPEITNFVEGVLEQLGADPATAYKVQLVVDEACTNVIKHAYSGDGGPLKLVMELVGNDLVITIEDRGKPFDVRTVPPPDLDADIENRKIGGLGIYFMKKLMDEVSYGFSPEEGNRLTMRKRLMQTPK